MKKFFNNLMLFFKKWFKKIKYFLCNKVSKKSYFYIACGIVLLMILIVILDLTMGNRKISCKFDGEMVQGAEFVNGIYTYHYMQDGNNKKWKNISEDGWGVKLTNISVTEVKEAPCSTINGKNVVSMSYMFANAKNLSNVNVRKFNTSNVIDMSYMFYMVGKEASEVKILGLNKLDTSNVTNMSHMFAHSGFKSNRYLLDGIRKFDTSNVENMESMFEYAAYKTKDLVLEDISSWDISKVTNMKTIFGNFAYYASNIDLGDLSKWKVSDSVNSTNAFVNMGITSKYKVPSWYKGDSDDKLNFMDNSGLKNILNNNILNSKDKKEESKKEDSKNK